MIRRTYLTPRQRNIFCIYLGNRLNRYFPKKHPRHEIWHDYFRSRRYHYRDDIRPREVFLAKYILAKVIALDARERIGMTHAQTTVKDMYNMLVRHYSFDIESLRENEPSGRARFLMTERARESMTNRLRSLSDIAESLGEKDIAGEILSAAANLGSDAVVPKPM